MSKLRQSMVLMLDELGEASGCHRMKERSFFYKGHQFPVCARCTGVFFGELTAVLLFFFKKLLSISTSSIMLMIMGIDWGVQELGIKESNNIRRLITGFLGGLGLFSIYINLIKMGFSKLQNIVLHLREDS